MELPVCTHSYFYIYHQTCQGFTVRAKLLRKRKVLKRFRELNGSHPLTLYPSEEGAEGSSFMENVRSVKVSQRLAQIMWPRKLWVRMIREKGTRDAGLWRRDWTCCNRRANKAAGQVEKSANRRVEWVCSPFYCRASGKRPLFSLLTCVDHVPLWPWRSQLHYRVHCWTATHLIVAPLPLFHY